MENQSTKGNWGEEVERGFKHRELNHDEDLTLTAASWNECAAT